MIRTDGWTPALKAFRYSSCFHAAACTHIHTRALPTSESQTWAPHEGTSSSSRGATRTGTGWRGVGPEIKQQNGAMWSGPKRVSGRVLGQAGSWFTGLASGTGCGIFSGAVVSRVRGQLSACGQPGRPWRLRVGAAAELTGKGSP